LSISEHYDDWTHVEPQTFTNVNLESSLDRETNEYLALFGASELFAQLENMEPKQPRKKRNTPKRNAGASELFA